MQSLDAALAFGITMLILAMVVTTIVETLHRLAGLREKGLALLLANFYERVLVARAAGQTGDTEERRAFIEMMTANRGPVGMAQLPRLRLRHRDEPDRRARDRRFLNWLWSGRRLGSLSADTFMERLGSSPLGARLVMRVSDAGNEGLELLLKDLVQKFDAFGREASEYFESRARLLSVLVGFVLAGALNVNAIALFDTFMKRPDVTNAVIAKSDEVTKAYRDLQAKVETLNTTASATVKDAGAAAADDNAAAKEQLADLRTQVRQAAEQADSSVKNLGALGVPIGWNAENLGSFERSPTMTALGLLLGGLLIGLGAPFWYRAVQALTGIRNATRGSQDGTSTPAAAPPPSGPHQTPGTPIEAFHAAFGAVVATGDLRLPEEAVG